MKATTPSLSALRPAVEVLGGNYFSLAESFQRSLKARKCSPKTIDVYLDAARLFGAYLASNGHSLDVREVTPAHIRDWEQHIHDQGGRDGGPAKPSTVNNRHRALQAFWRFLAEEEEVDVNPMERVKAPMVKEVRMLQPVTEDMWRKLFKGCEGKDHASRRDMAILRLFAATPLRLSELAGLKLEDVDFANGKVRVLGKGGHYRDSSIDAQAEAALDRYLRVRDRHPRARKLAWLWLGPRGQFTNSGIYQMVKDRARAAGFPDVHPHAFRSTFAVEWLRAGRGEQGLMRQGGWHSRAMVARYTAAASDELAHEEYQRFAAERGL